MKTLLKVLSLTGLALTIIPSFLIITGDVTVEQNKILMAVGTLVWFLTVPFWMGREKSG